MSEQTQPPTPTDAQSVDVSKILIAETPTPTGAPAASLPSASEPAAAIESDAEKDSAGVPFDPARHNRRKHPSTGRWMPKGGRKPGRSSASTSPGQSPGAGLNDTPPRAASFIPADAPPTPAQEGEPAAASASSNPPPPPVVEIDQADNAAEVGVCVAVAAAGFVFDEDCAPAAAEEKNMRKATAAYIRAKGWQFSAGLGLVLVYAAYLLRLMRKEKPRGKVREWLRFASAKNVTPPKPAGVSPAPSSEPAAQSGVPAHVPPLAPVS